MTEDIDFSIISKDEDYWNKIIEKTKGLITDGKRSLLINEALLKFSKEQAKLYKAK